MITGTMKQSKIAYRFMLATAVFAAWFLGTRELRADDLGRTLRTHFVWTDQGASPAPAGWLHGEFRKDFALAEVPREARFHVFAYSRYMLFVNGQYVGRGPNRFELRRPEYDTWDLSGRLAAGKNSIALLVHRDWSTGNWGAALSRIRQHAPGLTALLETRNATGARQQLGTDATWAGFAAKEFDPIGRCYSSIPENIDARAGNGEWTAPGYNADALSRAATLDTHGAEDWPELEPRTIPLLRETSIPFATAAGAPATCGSKTASLEPGDELKIFCPRMVQAYPVLDINAVAGATVTMAPLDAFVHPFRNSYICREGHQRWIGGDTFAFRNLSIKVAGGAAKITVADIREVLYPFVRVGEFCCSDPLLNKIWQLTANSTALLSEDAYTDCADRERSEWMDCDPPIYDASRVMMAGPGPNGGPLWSDPRLLKNMILRVALTQVDSGMVKARTCSDLSDVHTFMEDRACDWISGIRKYYESTGDKAWVELLWPYVDRQVKWFLERRQPTGLIRAREWIAWDNPVRYLVCEGTGNNAFFYRAIADAGYLAGQIGRGPDAARLTATAEGIRQALNDQLWNPAASAYWAGQGKPALVLTDVPQMRKDTKVPTTGGKMDPTMHANLYALDQGVVPADRVGPVADFTIRNEARIKGIMSNHYYFKLLYSLDRPDYDQRVLDRIRNNWKEMADGPTGVTWEGFGKGGSHMHCYGIVPGYTLSTFVLGVRRDAPVWKKELVIDPRLADLTEAHGTVLSEFGPVAVQWTRAAERLTFHLTIPEGIRTHIRLPDTDAASVHLEGATASAVQKGRATEFDTDSGVVSGYVMRGKPAATTTPSK